MVGEGYWIFLTPDCRYPVKTNDMPDISMCANTTCPLRHDCYRFFAQPSEYAQSYGDFEPEISDGIVKCEYFTRERKTVNSDRVSK